MTAPHTRAARCSDKRLLRHDPEWRLAFLLPNLRENIAGSIPSSIYQHFDASSQRAPEAFTSG
jgi:hypothetical protein